MQSQQKSAAAADGVIVDRTNSGRHPGEDVLSDVVLSRIGTWGRWQTRIFLLLALKWTVHAWQVLSYSYVAPEQDHWCARPADLPPEYADLTAEEWKDLAIPLDEVHARGHVGPSGKIYSRCEMFDFSDGHPNRSNVVPCNAWEYDRSTFAETMTSEWDLVCGRNAVRRAVGGVYMAGYFAGVLLYGIASDKKFGRRNAMLITSLQFTVFSVAAAFCNDVYSFMAMRFLTAAGVAGSTSVSIVLVMEVIGAKYRPVVGIGLHIFFALGATSLPLIAYIPFMRSTWRYIQLAISIPSAFALVYYWYLPESPRWLISQGRTHEAECLLEEAEICNGTRKPQDDHHGDHQKELELQMAQAKLEKEQEAEASKNMPQASLLDLIRTPNMRKKSLKVFYIWFANGLVYYGLSMNVGDLGGNIFLTGFIIGAVEVVALFVCVYAVMHMGRKIPLCIVLVGGGLACTLILAIPSGEYYYNWPTLTLASIGKLGIGGSFAIMYVLSPELFPTVVRNTGVSASSMCARIGSTIAPFIPLVDDQVGGFHVSMLIFGGTAAMAGALALLLPETNHRKLPETVEEGEDFK